MSGNRGTRPGLAYGTKRLIGLVLLILAGMVAINAVIGIANYLGPTEFVVIMAVAVALAVAGHWLRATPATPVS